MDKSILSDFGWNQTMVDIYILLHKIKSKEYFRLFMKTDFKNDSI